jgi:hypothetical protein
MAQSTYIFEEVTHYTELLKNKKEEIESFLEKPSAERYKENCHTSVITPSELFSLFTADIIQEETLFTR